MKLFDLLKLNHKEARQLTKKTEGAQEVEPTHSIEEYDARLRNHEKQVEMAYTLYGEAISRGLVRDFGDEYGVADYRLPKEVESALNELTFVDAKEAVDHKILEERDVREPIRAEQDDSDIELLVKLLCTLPKEPKKTGKKLTVERGVVALTINTGKREYCFNFPASTFES